VPDPETWRYALQRRIVRGLSRVDVVAVPRQGEQSNELGLRNDSFVVADLQASVDGLAADGHALVGGIGQHENIGRMA
jgi:hypothetical protein